MSSFQNTKPSNSLLNKKKQGLGILLPGRSYGNQDLAGELAILTVILLPGRSYGNQDFEASPLKNQTILLPGRSYGNQDTRLF